MRASALASIFSPGGCHLSKTDYDTKRFPHPICIKIRWSCIAHLNQTAVTTLWRRHEIFHQIPASGLKKTVSTYSIIVIWLMFYSSSHAGGFYPMCVPHSVSTGKICNSRKVLESHLLNCTFPWLKTYLSASELQRSPTIWRWMQIKTNTMICSYYLTQFLQVSPSLLSSCQMLNTTPVIYHTMEKHKVLKVQVTPLYPLSIWNGWGHRYLQSHMLDE